MADLSDAGAVTAALGIAAAAGWLQYSLSSGERGINAFLFKEKGDNPFYSNDFKADKPSPPSWFRVRLPALPFVEVYGQSDTPSSPIEFDNSERAQLYRELDAAIEREDYEAARRIMRIIDGEVEQK
jgi:hypothetical protein|eukprot:CAMPEP_0181248284 /NCGR_PEP_ID=MMETSP1096-20121128/45083_1 /TAXON_ID=156174 ORGANISM="Chrysochromulina ericina, Strain CCMP281" /NCGR_SAMPLE_ID=MMETSP1096 /ASSEMBLY_ACC=CAM_ASM_000453 /LENGTH=126 /DNA_ID=CAMNT_0023345433 /DNA_START=248 /DNA_END=628 /DNA_ORIENTATION=-